MIVWEILAGAAVVVLSNIVASVYARLKSNSILRQFGMVLMGDEKFNRINERLDSVDERLESIEEFMLGKLDRNLKQMIADLLDEIMPQPPPPPPPQEFTDVSSIPGSAALERADREMIAKIAEEDREVLERLAGIPTPRRQNPLLKKLGRTNHGTQSTEER